METWACTACVYRNKPRRVGRRCHHHAMCAPEDEDKQIQWEPDRARWEPINPTQTVASPPKAAQMSRKFAAFLLVLTCFDSFVVCESHLFIAKVDREKDSLIQRI